ncbi:MAG: NAD-dependent epimerase/dehydratase family protein, partial [Blastocatellales bacterium]|nr:NAD-dependent epimerase/dehydratase family protein [Blastocatellales bacterium]
MKKVMILGGSGMLGHQLWLNYCDRFDTSITFRQTPRRSITDRISNHVRIFDGVSVSDPDSITRTLIQVRPDVVINCIGIVKQDPAAKDHYSSIAVNSLFP